MDELTFDGRVAIVTGAGNLLDPVIMSEAGDGYAPELVTPLVVYLLHESCDRNGNFYSVGGGKVSRVFIGSTAGIQDPGLTPEKVASAIDQIDETSEWELR